MNKIFNFNRRYEVLPIPSTAPKVYIDKVATSSDVTDNVQQLLNAIYSVDPITGHPKGDLAIYLSSNANAEVKQFIEQNLLHPNVSESGALSPNDSLLNSMKKNITDEDIAQFSRKRSESVQEYADRLQNWFSEQKLNADRKRMFKEIIDSAKPKVD